ncbi:hypothetical protein [Leptolyngbya iicbica]|uniref:Uncharacterized protein n=2 Tax=Cyanophyceae TaxID=3028117 RepID=A0A4Q7E8D3_9CYAN|nr:hypothetical protein [Leptolyngbya sp. LK]RZM78733.1 hypothetical protein DYY88_07990 [Leptolyngbya sp. LK]
MVCPNEIQVRQQLEKAYQRSPATPFRLQIWSFLRQIGAALVEELTRDRNQPRVSKFYTVEGEARWHIYDPHSGQRFTYPSESDVLDWLETRYSR